MIYIIFGILIILFVVTLLMYNTFVKINNKVKEAFSTMDVYLKKRFDLIPNLVETVKSYASHEKNTLEEVARLRNLDYDKMTSNEKIKANGEINSCISKLLMIAENYPELKANENFLKLSDELTQIENDIANSRKYYNGCVRQFNNTVEIFPNNIFARIFGYSSKKWFEATDDERENVRVKL